MKSKFLIWYYNKIGYLFCETAFRLWVVLEWYWNRYKIGVEFDDECLFQKICEWFYDIGAHYYDKAIKLEEKTNK